MWCVGDDASAIYISAVEEYEYSERYPWYVWINLRWDFDIVDLGYIILCKSTTSHVVSDTGIGISVW